MLTRNTRQSHLNILFTLALILCTIILVACLSGVDPGYGDNGPDDALVDAGADTCHIDCDLTSSDIDAPVNIDPSWQEVFSDLDGALLSVWGTGPDNIWTTGSDPGDGLGPYVLHYDGQNWARFENSAEGAIWWIRGDEEGTLWMCGEQGQILTLDPATGEFTDMDTPTDARLFGVVPIAPDNVWAVGGQLMGNTGEVLHYDGNEWTLVEDIPEEASSAGQLFKVWARSADDLWIVGLGNVALHYNGTDWTTFDIEQMIFTVHGNAETAVAVGGTTGTALVVELTTEGINDITPTDADQLVGVWVSESGGLAEHRDRITSVGMNGDVWYREDGTWLQDTTAPTISDDYHAVYVDSEGGAWAVGGYFASPPQHDGVLTYYGTQTVSTVFP
jgi:hypothetical protein